MSKALNATCQAGVVTTEGKKLTGPVILSEGIGPSTGVVLLDEEKAFYLVKGSPDLSLTLTQIATALGAVKTALDAISVLFATMSPPVWDVLPAGAAAAATAKTAVDTASGTVNSAKSTLETLKNNLR